MKVAHLGRDTALGEQHGDAETIGFYRAPGLGGRGHDGFAGAPRLGRRREATEPARRRTGRRGAVPQVPTPPSHTSIGSHRTGIQPNSRSKCSPWKDTSVPPSAPRAAGSGLVEQRGPGGSSGAGNSRRSAGCAAPQTEHRGECVWCANALGDASCLATSTGCRQGRIATEVPTLSRLGACDGESHPDGGVDGR